MKAVSKHVANERDLSLLEKRYDIADTADTTGGQTGVGIDYITLSADTMHIPRHPGRIRANLLLGAWRLELVRDDALSSSSVSTKITYVFQTDIRGSVPSTLTKRYLSKRASIGVAGLKRYFEKKGVTALMNSNKDRGFVKDPLLRLGETGSRRDVRQKKYIQPPISNGFTADCTSEYAGDEENSNDNHRHRGLSVATSAAVVANANYLITPPSSIRGVHPYPQQLHCEDGSSIDISTTNIISSLSASFSSSDDQLLSPDDSSLGLLSSPAHPPPSAPLPPIPVECTISSESSEAIDYFKSLLAKSDSCWNLASEQKGVKISFLSSTEGTSASSGNMPIVRGDFVWRDFSAKGFSIDDWMAAVTSAGARKICKSLCVMRASDIFTDTLYLLLCTHTNRGSSIRRF